MIAFSAHDYLNSFTNYETHLQKLQSQDFNLNRIHQLLNFLDQPQNKLRVIHVAGTKGKGSTCAFISSILQRAGYKVGLYTSPHLHRVNERIRILHADNIDSQEQFPGEITDDDLGNVLTELRPHIAKIINEGGFLTYFEVLTAAALVYFVKQGVDFVVLETGLGGRLDATNVAEAIISVITPISLDHTKILGPTLKKIAEEKAGIIKHDSQKVVIAPQETEAMEAIIERCKEFGIQPLMVVPDQYKDLKIALKGAHQTLNAATALNVIQLLRQMGVKISDEATSEGLKYVRWSGRFEVILEKPTVVVDCAHNGAAARALARTIIDVYPYKRIVLVLGVSADKDVEKICEHLKDNASHIILTNADHARAHQFNEDEAKTYFGDKSWCIIPNLPKAVDEAIKLAREQDIVLITGSVFVVGQAMEHLLKPPQSRGGL